MAFPSVASTLLFPYTSGYYAVSIFLSVFSSYLFLKYNKILLPAILLACSIGIYQAYFSLAICICLIFHVYHGVQGKYSWTLYIKTGIRYFLFLVVGLLAYFLLLKLSLFLSHTSLSSYRGIDTMGQYSIHEFLMLIGSAYKDFFGLLLKPYHGINASPVLRFGLFFFGIYSVFLFVKYLKGTAWDKGIILISSFLIPLAINIIIIMSKNRINTMMLYSSVFIFLIPILLTDLSLSETLTQINFDWFFEKRFFFQKICIALLALCALNYVWTNNINYTILYYTNRQTENYFNNLVADIKDVPGYDTDLKVAFIGENIQDNSYYNRLGTLTCKYDEYRYNMLNEYSRPHFIRVYTGYTLPFADEATVDQLATDHRVARMECYPNDGSIQIIDNVIVVKLEEVTND